MVFAKAREKRIEKLFGGISSAIVGKEDVISLVVTALLARGHVLLEDVPGVGKTRLVSALADSCGGEFHRIQMTPDIMPGDITGFSMIKQSTGEQEFRKGAAFCNFLLADEINRSSPKSQSALLEIMEEHQVSMDGITYDLPDPFMVLATQNPVETYGTYHLPEAQMDRFLMKLSMGYPNPSEEKHILKHNASTKAKENLVEKISLEDIKELQKMADDVFVSEAIEEYIIRIVAETRNHQAIKLGVSPRGSIALYQASKAFALVSGESSVFPEMVKHLAPFVLGHRIMLSSGYNGTKDATFEVIESILGGVEVPI